MPFGYLYCVKLMHSTCESERGLVHHRQATPYEDDLRFAHFARQVFAIDDRA